MGLTRKQVLFVILLVMNIGWLANAKKPTCEVPGVRKGDEFKLTCFFHQDIQQHKKEVEVKHYNGSDWDNIFKCNWKSSGYFCEVDSRFNESNVTSTLTLHAKATQDLEGEYECNILPAKKGASENCTFELVIDNPAQATKSQVPQDLPAYAVEEDEWTYSTFVLVVFGFVVLVMFVIAMALYCVITNRKHWVPLCERMRSECGRCRSNKGDTTSKKSPAASFSKSSDKDKEDTVVPTTTQKEDEEKTQSSSSASSDEKGHVLGKENSQSNVSPSSGQNRLSAGQSKEKQISSEEMPLLGAKPDTSSNTSSAGNGPTGTSCDTKTKQSLSDDGESQSFPVKRPQLPLNTFPDLNVFERYLEDPKNKKAEIGYFATFGGEDLQKVVKNVLDGLLTKTFAAECKPFFDKRPCLCKLLNDVVRKIYDTKDNQAVEKDINSAIEEYFKPASDSNGEGREDDALKPRTGHRNADNKTVRGPLWSRLDQI